MYKPFVMYPRDDHSDSLHELWKYLSGQMAILSETSAGIKGGTHLYGWKNCSGYGTKRRPQRTWAHTILLS